MTLAKTPTGIRIRHGRSCPSHDGRGCKCRPSFEAFVYSQRDGRKVRKAFATLAAAKAWRADATVQLSRGTMRAPTRTTLREAALEWVEGAKAGTIRKRDGRPYKPGVVRGYDQALRDHVLPQLGGARLSEIRRIDIQDFADRLRAKGLDPSTVRNAIAPLRVVFRRAVSRGVLAVNPTAGLELAAPEGRRDRIAAPDEAAALIAALREEDRTLWATAMYAGLRRGELLALEWANVDLAAGVIRIERSFDPKSGVFVEPKSKAGRRQVPIPAVLRDYLVEHKLRSGRSDGLVFGNGEQPFTSSNVWRRAQTAWCRAGLAPIGLHECRHTFASLMIAAGVNAKALSTYLGHSSIGITFDRYGHLMPGNEEEAAQLLDAYLQRANTAARLAQVGG